MMNNSSIPAVISYDQWNEACRVMGLPMSFTRLEFRPLEDHEREDFLVVENRRSYYVCEVSWHDHGYDQDQNLVLNPVTKKVLVNIHPTIKKEKSA